MEMPTPDNPVVSMSEDEAWAFLRTQEVGRLALTAGGIIDIYPITFVVDDRSIVFITSPGTKLLELTVNDQVAFEVDAYDQSYAKSVVLHGTAQRLETSAEIEAAEKLPLASLIPTVKTRFVRVHAASITGRVFSRG